MIINKDQHGRESSREMRPRRDHFREHDESQDSASDKEFACACEARLYDEILDCCLRAYENGVSASDIHKTLCHNILSDSCGDGGDSTSGFDKQEQQVKPQTSLITACECEREFHPCRSQSHETTHEPTRDSDVPVNRVRQRNSCTVSVYSLSVGFLLLVAVSPFVHFFICHLLNTNPLKVFPNLTAQKCLVSLHATILEMIRPPANCSALCASGTNSRSPIIELPLKPSPEEFEPIAYASRPVVVRNSNPSLPDFNFKMLKEIFELESGGVESVSKDCQFLPFRSTFTSLADAFNKIDADDFNAHEPWYIGWSNCHPGVAAKLRARYPRPDFLPLNSESSIIDWIFVGSPRSGAAMHIDYVRRPSWQLQLSGIKSWALKPPPECESECPESIDFTSYPGDYVFLDTNLWYHGTFIEGAELSISIGSEYD